MDTRLGGRFCLGRRKMLVQVSFAYLYPRAEIESYNAHLSLLLCVMHRWWFLLFCLWWSSSCSDLFLWSYFFNRNLWTLNVHFFREGRSSTRKNWTENENKCEWARTYWQGSFICVSARELMILEMYRMIGSVKTWWSTLSSMQSDKNREKKTPLGENYLTTTYNFENACYNFAPVACSSSNRYCSGSFAIVYFYNPFGHTYTKEAFFGRECFTNYASIHLFTSKRNLCETCTKSTTRQYLKLPFFLDCQAFIEVF